MKHGTWFGLMYLRIPYPVPRIPVFGENMLTILRIKNYALLRDIEMEFTPGLNILTGETGAGKSIIISALNIAVGERGYTENIRTGEEKAIVEAVFDLKGGSGLKAAVKTCLDGAGIEMQGNKQGRKRKDIHQQLACGPQFP